MSEKFFKFANKINVSNILELLQSSDFSHDSITNKTTALNSIQIIDSFDKNAIVFYSKNNLDQALSIANKCGVLIVSKLIFKRLRTLDKLIGNVIAVDNPKLVISYLASKLYIDLTEQASEPKKYVKNNITYSIGKNCKIDPSTKIANGVVIGDNVIIGANCYIGKYVVIGSNCQISKNSTIDTFCHITYSLIGEECKIGSFTKTGHSGFGFEINKKDIIRITHIGYVEIANNVELGVHNTVTRGMLKNTIIGNNTKIDDKCHIAHNCQIGKNCLIAGNVIFGGNSIIGNNVIIGGQTAISDNIIITDEVKIGGSSGVAKNILDKGVWFGIPARPIKSYLKALAKMYKK